MDKNTAGNGKPATDQNYVENKVPTFETRPEEQADNNPDSGVNFPFHLRLFINFYDINCNHVFISFFW